MQRQRIALTLVAWAAVLLEKGRCGMPSNAAYRMLNCAYLVLAVLFWPFTTLISTAYALALKLPCLRLPAIRLSAFRFLARRAARPGQIVDLVK